MPATRDTSPPSGAAALQRQGIETIRLMWSKNTWTERNKIMLRFDRFMTEHKLSIEEDLEWGIIMFIESTSSTTVASSRLTYSKALTAMFHKMGTSTPLVQLHQAGLRVASAGTPILQATPALTSQIDRMLLRAAPMDDNLDIAIWIAWKTCSRWDEISNIIGRSIIRADSETIIIAGATAPRRREPIRSVRRPGPSSNTKLRFQRTTRTPCGSYDQTRH